MAWRVVVAPRARADIEEIVALIAEDSVVHAMAWYDTLRSRLAALERAPRRCPRAWEEDILQVGLRQLVHGRYRVLLTLDDDRKEVLVLTVRHGARRPIELEDL